MGCRELRCLGVLNKAISIRGPAFAPPWPTACYLQVFLDGARVWSASGAQSTPYDLNQHSLRSLEAVEVYTGADTPAEFGITGSACGTIVLWTRER